MTQTNSPHFAALQFHRNHNQGFAHQLSPANVLLLAAQVSLVDFDTSIQPFPTQPNHPPAATSATSARRSDSCPDRVHAANPWRSALFSECRPATWPETNSAAAPASCAGWFPPWERSGVGTRYRTSCLVGSSNPSWPSSSDKRTPLASGHRADTRSKLARWQTVQ